MVVILIAVTLSNFVITAKGYPVDDVLIGAGLGARIVGGADAPEAYAPHMAAILWGDSVRSLMCGGSLISVQNLLTAAHCIDPLVANGELLKSAHAVVGSNFWNSTKNMIRFRHFLNHPSWDSVRVKNDIGVLFLAEELALNDRVSLVSLSFDWVGGDVPTFVTGWGRLGVRITTNIVIIYPFPDRLQLLNLETLSPDKCAAALKSVQTIGNIELDSELEICTFHSLGHGMCYGDSGSPVIIRESGEQIGIASWAYPCARGVPDISVRISSYKDFLHAYISV